MSETAFIHCLMLGDELIPKRSPDKYQRLIMIKDIYHVKYSVRNSRYSLPDDGTQAYPKTYY